MNPYPLSALNHFTVPVAIDETPPLLTSGTGRGGTRRASGTRSDSRTSVAAIRTRLEQSVHGVGPCRPSYLFAFLACRFSFSVFWAGFFSMLFFVFLSLLVMFRPPCGCDVSLQLRRGSAGR